MKKLLVSGSLLFGSYMGVAQSAPATNVEAVMDTAAYDAFCRTLAAYNAAQAARRAQPCPYAPSGTVPACVGGHRDRVIPVVYGLVSSVEVAKRAKRSELKLGGCLVTDCDPHYYCLLHNKYL
jgi:hypothetical protein